MCHDEQNVYKSGTFVGHRAYNPKANGTILLGFCWGNKDDVNIQVGLQKYTDTAERTCKFAVCFEKPMSNISRSHIHTGYLISVLFIGCGGEWQMSAAGDMKRSR